MGQKVKIITAFLSILVLILAGWAVYFGWGLTDLSSEGSQKAIDSKLENSIADWNTAKDNKGLFALKYPSSFRFFPTEFSNYGDGVLCHEGSNWEQVMNDEMAESRLHGCLLYSILASKLDLVTYGERNYKPQMSEPFGNAQAHLIDKKTIKLGSTDFLNVQYSFESGETIYFYVAKLDANRLVEFTYSYNNSSYLSTIEKILSTSSTN